MRTRCAVALLCSFLVAVASCSGSGDSSATIQAQAEDRLPFSTLAEARTFADFWAVAEVSAERCGDPEGGAKGEGFVPRTITLVLHDALWRNDIYTAGFDLPHQFDMAVLGHAFHDHESIPLVVDGAPHLEVGESYLLGLILESDQLALPSPRAAFHVTNGTIAGLDDANPEETVADDLRGMVPSEAVDAVLHALLLVTDQSLSPDERHEQLLRTGGE